MIQARVLGVLFLLSSLVLPAPVWAQNARAVVDVSSLASAAHQRQARLSTPVDVALDDVPLAEALERVTRAAHNGSLVYSSDLLPEGRRVTYRGRRVPVGTVFAELLKATRLGVQEASSGRFVLTRVAPEQAGLVMGRVRDRATRRPVPGVSVVVEGTGRGALSGSDGRYSISDVPSGRHTLTATSVGYAPASRMVEVRDGETTSADVDLESVAVDLEELVVTGTLIPTPVKAVPTPITVVRAAEIQRQNLQDIHEVFQLLIPGAVAAELAPELGGLTSFSVRGKSSFLNSNNVKVYVDGVEVAHPAYLDNLNPDLVERVEFSAGPQASTVYGSGAIGGVMQIFTRKGEQGSTEPVVSGRVALGLIDDRHVEDATPISREYAVDVSGGGGDYGYTLAGSWEEESDYINFASGESGSVAATGNMVQGSFQADISARYRLDRGLAGLDPFSLMMEWDNLGNPPPTDQYETRHTGLAGTFAYAMGERWMHNLSLGTNDWERSNFSEEPRGLSPSDTLVRVNEQGLARTTVRYHTLIDLPSDGPLGANLTLGANHSRIASSAGGAQGLQAEGRFQQATFARSSYSTSGIFGQAQMGFHDVLFLTFGLHGDRSETIDGTTWSPRVGAAWSHGLGEVDLKLRTSFGSALVAPTADHRNGYFLGSFQRVLANPELGPEKQTGWDAGVELYWGSRASLSLSYYDQVAEGLIYQVNFGFDPEERRTITQFQNLGEVRNRGFEASLSLAPTESVRLTGVFGSARSTVRSVEEGYTGAFAEGDALTDVPDWTAGATVTWFPRPGTTVNGSLRHRAEWIGTSFEGWYGALFGGDFTAQPSDHWVTYPAFTKFNLGVSQDFSEHFGAFVHVTNLGNDYAYEASDLFYARGREMKVGLRFSTR